MVAEIILTPANGPVGTVVTVDGTGFTPLGEATIKFATVLQATTPTPVAIDGAGAFSCTFVVPAAVEGANAVLAEDGVLSDDADFTVEPQIVITESNAQVGDTINVVGTGFDTISLMSFTLNGDAIVPVGGAVTTDATGGFTTTFVVIAEPQGTQTLVGTDAGTNDDSDTIIIDPKLITNPDTGEVGSTITVIGTGFTASEDIVVRVEGILAAQISAISSDAQGSFSGAIIIPAGVPLGTVAVSAVDESAITDSSNIIIISGLADPLYNGPMAYRKLASGLYTNPSEQVDGTNMEDIIIIDARNYDKVLFVIQNIDDRADHNLDYNIFGSLDPNGDNPPAFSTATWAQILTSNIEVAIGATKASVVTDPYIWLCLAAKKTSGDGESIASIFIRGINTGHNS